MRLLHHRDRGLLGEHPEERVQRPVATGERHVERLDRIGETHQVTGRDPGVERVHPLDRRQVERRHDHPVDLRPVVQQPDHLLGDGLGRVEVEVLRRVLDLDVDEETPALLEHLLERRQPRERLPDRAEPVLGQDPEALDVGVVVDHEGAVGGAVDVELDPVGALLPGEREGLDGVLPGPARRAPVPEDQRGVGGHARSVFACRLQKGRSRPLQRVLVRP